MTLISASILLFFILDPLGNLPVFNYILQGIPPRRRFFIIVRECLFGLAVLLAFLFGGAFFMSMLGLNEESLGIGGGIVLLLIALKMVFPPPGGGLGITEKDEEPFLVPLGVPLIVGPSALAYILLLASRHPEKMPHWVAAVTIAWTASSLILLLSSKLESWLGRRTLKAGEKLMGMLLILVAVQMILDGVTTLRE